MGMGGTGKILPQLGIELMGKVEFHLIYWWGEVTASGDRYVGF